MEAAPHESAGLEPPVGSEKIHVTTNNPIATVIPTSKALLQVEDKKLAIPRVIVRKLNQASLNTATLPAHQPIPFGKAGVLPIRIAQPSRKNHQPPHVN